MLIIPAIDIKDGRCVRLLRGEMDRETVYYDSPVEAAKNWVAHGAAMLHVVDLNGAVEGRPVHADEVAAICRDVPVPVELGGGLRTLESVEGALETGLHRVVLGTSAYQDRAFLQAACKRWPGRIVVGIDARGGRVALKGWKEDTAMEAVELARRSEADGAALIVYTDISRDGTQSGVNTEETQRVARSVGIPVIASGGVATLEDVRRLKEIEGDGVEGVIIGRALYTGSLTLEEAILAGQ